ncbi:MAG: glycosyltransferase family 4 protein [Pseudomonadota bacterium]
MEPGIAYFWPTASAELVEFAKHNGWVTVREMTNRTMAAAKLTLDGAFAKAGEERPHHISQARVDEELAVLPTFDFVFSSNEDVDRSLLSAGVEESRILKSTFGWAERRFGSQSSEVTNKGSLTVGYLGMISIGKGVKDLIDGWKAWPGDGKLRLAGPLDWSMEDDVKALVASDPRVELHGYVEDIEAFYRSCDVLVVPTLDEGGPQVTYEMGAVGAAIIATPMAKARMLVDGRNALIVAEHSPTAIREALSRLATDVELRSQIGRQAKLDVQKFSYAHVGKERAEMLLNRVKALRSAASVSSQSR